MDIDHTQHKKEMNVYCEVSLFALHSFCKGGLFSFWMSFDTCLCHETFFLNTIKFHLFILLSFIPG